MNSLKWKNLTVIDPRKNNDKVLDMMYFWQPAVLSSTILHYTKFCKDFHTKQQLKIIYTASEDKIKPNISFQLSDYFVIEITEPTSG